MQPCYKCKSVDLRMDDWQPMSGKLSSELFIRCMGCGRPGPGAETEAKAEEAWDAEAIHYTALLRA
jgi:hypothetical protein